VRINENAPREMPSSSVIGLRKMLSVLEKSECPCDVYEDADSDDIPAVIELRWLGSLSHLVYVIHSSKSRWITTGDS
jgi:hypothetical protein